uniref:Serine/threonine-protein phosphatase 7 long form homolog n=1 Tax=Nicotiana tabacum TaxID=4097 RepID=A0A1S3ZID7_TOBAC|nr:PREDICTED: serine/threonine-protein phosphatase 7 long form homolog [Nicotiana tabacum]
MHTFYLPIGEATITLQDVEVMYGLPVDGHPVAMPHAMREQTGLQYLDILQRLTGLQPPEETALVGASRLQLTTVRQHLEALHPDITDDTPELHIHWYTRLLLLLMFGGVLFPNSSGNLVSLRFLHHLERLNDLPQYNWGVAVLGYLYMQMCRASMGTQRDVARLLPLLQFIWRPYNDELIAGLPDYCSVNQIMWSSSIPLMFLDIVEHHATERVLRQFGRPQLKKQLERALKLLHPVQKKQLKWRAELKISAPKVTSSSRGIGH